MTNLKTILTLIFFSTLLNFSFAQSTQTRKVEDFNGIDSNEGIIVELTTSNKTSVVVIADESIIGDVITEVKENTLHVYIKGNVSLKNRDITVKVSATEIDNLDASSGSSIITQNLLEAESLRLSASSGAHLKVAYKAPNSSCNTSSGASAKLKGVTKFFKGNSSSGSHIKAKELKCINAELETSSGASISVSVEKELEAQASSGGSIDYYGSPKMVDVSKSSGGSIHKN